MQLVGFCESYSMEIATRPLVWLQRSPGLLR